MKDQKKIIQKLKVHGTGLWKQKTKQKFSKLVVHTIFQNLKKVPNRRCKEIKIIQI
jgi:hypothetical protein